MSELEVPDFSTWDQGHLIDQRKHLEQILAVSAGQKDWIRPQLRAELEAIRAEIARRQ